MRIFGREPALVLEALKALIIVLAMAVPAFTPEIQEATIVIATALFGLLTALMTRPPEVAAISETIQTVGVAIAAYGVAISADMLGAIVLLSGAVVTLLQRSQVSPASVPARTAHGQASGYTILRVIVIGVVALIILWALIQLLSVLVGAD